MEYHCNLSVTVIKLQISRKELGPKINCDMDWIDIIGRNEDTITWLLLSFAIPWEIQKYLKNKFAKASLINWMTAILITKEEIYLKFLNSFGYSKINLGAKILQIISLSSWKIEPWAKVVHEAEDADFHKERQLRGSVGIIYCDAELATVRERERWVSVSFCVCVGGFFRRVPTRYVIRD